MKARLIIAGSETNSDMYYATRVLIPDEFIYIEIDGRKTIYVSDLEFSRALQEATVDEVINVFSCPKKYKNVLSWIVAEKEIKEVSVPENFPIKYAEALRKLKVEIRIKPGAFFEERVVKSEKEIKNIRTTQRVNEKAMQVAIEAIGKSKIRKDRKLEYENKILTSELLKEFIEIEFVKGGCKSEDDIVSCGKDTSQPHNAGNGPLYADQPIIIDIYPKSSRNRYFADMTRTVVKGKASPEIRKIYNTVLEGQKLAIKNVKAGIETASLHKSVDDYFEKSGYRTILGSRSPEGFIHNLGHGVGLDIHERPFLSGGGDQRLEAGNVITIEPGLYFPKIGGVRIEDMVLVKKDGCENLTKSPKFLEIK